MKIQSLDPSWGERLLAPGMMVLGCAFLFYGESFLFVLGAATAFMMAMQVITNDIFTRRLKVHNAAVSLGLQNVMDSRGGS